MNAIRLRRQQDLFEAALERPHPERPTFLEGQCPDEPTLRAEVLALLAFDHPTPAPVAAATPPAADGRLGLRVGPYELQQRLGGGGMGTVYLAVRVDDYRQQVAVKIMNGGPNTVELLRRFAVERQALADLQHPNVARLLDGGTTADGLPFLVMEYVPGPSLQDVIAGQGPLPPRDAAALVFGVAAGVAHAHARGILHRDLKPANILLQAAEWRTAIARPEDAPGLASATSRLPTAVPKITDFGLAKNLAVDDQLTPWGAALGTPGFMAPEQVLGRVPQLGPLCDLYGLGATLYCLLTGRPPFQGKTLLETLQQVVNEEPPSPRTLRPGVDADLETICLKCLAKDPRDRYASVAEFGADLERYINHLPILARPGAWWERLRLWRRRSPVVAGLSALVALLAMMVALQGAALSVGGLHMIAPMVWPAPEEPNPLRVTPARTRPAEGRDYQPEIIRDGARPNGALKKVTPVRIVPQKSLADGVRP